MRMSDLCWGLQFPCGGKGSAAQMRFVFHDNRVTRLKVAFQGKVSEPWSPWNSIILDLLPGCQGSFGSSE